MLVWIDLETTGLDPEFNDVIEVACIVTDNALNEVARFHRLVLTDAELNELDPVVEEMHTSSGLWEAAKRDGVEIDEADVALADFIKAHAPRAQLAGSTIGFDREFMRYHFPVAITTVHYRSLDVTSLNEMALRFWPKAYENRPRNGTKAHRAMADIEESLRVARHYAAALEQK